MGDKLILLFVSIVLSLNLVYSDISEDKNFACEFIENIDSQVNPCLSDDSCDIAYYTTGSENGDGELINAKAGIDNPNPAGVNYSYALKCESDLEVEFEFEYRSGINRCSENQFEFGFLNKEHNSKLSQFYDLTYYNVSICLNTFSSDFGSLDIQIQDERNSDLESIGFDCMYRFSEDFSVSGDNAKLSSCDAEFTNPSSVIEQYPFLVYARLTPNIESSTCNQDCTSTIDGRIYQDCGDTIESCEGIPDQCDGSLKGQWVGFDSNKDILCEKDFDQFRSTTRSQSSITVSSQDNECQNIIVEKYSVQVDGEAVTMNIYVCEGQN